jgi:hypothetical protein
VKKIHERFDMLYSVFEQIQPQHRIGLADGDFLVGADEHGLDGETGNAAAVAYGLGRS